MERITIRIRAMAHYTNLKKDIVELEKVQKRVTRMTGLGHLLLYGKATEFEALV